MEAPPGTDQWLGPLDDSLAVLDRADEAVGDLLGVVVEHGEVTDLGRYAAGLSGLARWLREGRADGD